MVIVYGLCSTENGKIRYVGQTMQSLTKRFDSHIHHPKSRKDTYVNRWIRSVRRNGFSVQAFVIENDAVWNDAELRWIAWYKKNGARLVNLTLGGEGRTGYKMPEAQRAAISRAHKGRRKSPEHIEAIRQSRLGKSNSLESRAKQSASLKGRMPKNLAALHERNKGIARTPEFRARLSAIFKGRMVTPREQLLKNLGRVV